MESKTGGLGGWCQKVFDLCILRYDSDIISNLDLAEMGQHTSTPAGHFKFIEWRYQDISKIYQDISGFYVRNLKASSGHQEHRQDPPKLWASRCEVPGLRRAGEGAQLAWDMLGCWCKRWNLNFSSSCTAALCWLSLSFFFFLLLPLLVLVLVLVLLLLLLLLLVAVDVAFVVVVVDNDDDDDDDDDDVDDDDDDDDDVVSCC